MSLIIVEGNISAGKSSLCRSLASLLGFELFLEPTVTNPFLAKFYKDPKKWALRMQIWLLKQRFRTYISAIRHIIATGKGAILDRSIYSDWVFAERNRLDGNISEEGFAYYQALRDQMLLQLPTPHAMVYLDVAPEECFRRVHEVRCREEEEGIPLAYLAGLHDCYARLVEHMQALPVAVATYDWSSFGDPRVVAGHIRALPPVSSFNTFRSLHMIMNNEAVVRQAMSVGWHHSLSAHWVEDEMEEHTDTSKELAALTVPQIMD